MLQWTGAPTITPIDATNSDAVVTVTVTCTLTEGVEYWDDIDDGDPPYLTFMDGWRYRFDHWHMHLWNGEQLTSLVPIEARPRRTEEAGHSSRWTSGFK